MAKRPTIPKVSPVAMGVLFCIVAAVSFSGAGYIASQIIDQDTQGISIAFYEVILGVGFVLVLRFRSLIRPGQVHRSAMPWLILAGFCNALGIGGFYTALTYAPLSVAAPVSGIAPLVTYAFVFLLLRDQERITKRVLLGALLVVSGVVLVGVTNS